MDTAPGTRPAARLAACAWLAAAASYLASEALAALAFSPRYSYARNFISDLGVPVCGTIFDGRPVCSPLHWLMNGDFVAQGVLFALAALAATRLVSARARWALLACAVLNGIRHLPRRPLPRDGHGVGPSRARRAARHRLRQCDGAGLRLRLPRARPAAPHRLASVALPLLACVAFAALLAARAHGTTILVPAGILGADQRLHDHGMGASAAFCLVAWLRRHRTGWTGVTPSRCGDRRAICGPSWTSPRRRRRATD